MFDTSARFKAGTFHSQSRNCSYKLTQSQLLWNLIAAIEVAIPTDNVPFFKTILKFEKNKICLVSIDNVRYKHFASNFKQHMSTELDQLDLSALAAQIFEFLNFWLI